MGTWRFRKRINIMPGVSINLSKTGVSTTLGVKGLHSNISKRGVRTTVSAPGTGLSYSHLEPYKQQRPALPNPQKASNMRIASITCLILAALIVVLVLIAAGGHL
jgi:hypothetical protein